MRAKNYQNASQFEIVIALTKRVHYVPQSVKADVIDMGYNWRPLARLASGQEYLVD